MDMTEQAPWRLQQGCLPAPPGLHCYGDHCYFFVCFSCYYAARAEQTSSPFSLVLSQNTHILQAACRDAVMRRPCPQVTNQRLWTMSDTYNTCSLRLFSM